ncbi:beta-ketoacyl synthase N-terminal-like domain-containing protein, partial [Pseudoalteromonas piscicida]
MTDQNLRTGLEIAVIGMAGKFPSANNIEAFWHNLQNGIEGISRFSDAELLAEGVAEELLNNPAYVKANGLLDSPYLFDSGLFGYPAREAELLDPQLRVMHECAWEALENAGYDASTTGLSIGLFSGATDNLLWLRQVFQMVESSPGDLFEAESLIKRDYFATRLAYKLNLTGPAVNIQTACSTSLVATHMAVQSLLSGDCDMALAGGVSVQPKKEGYLYQEGMIGSPDGHCRAFDTKAKGTVGGEGVGLVLLKRLDDA